MAAPVERDDPPEAAVDVVIQKNGLALRLDDLVGRSDPRHAGVAAIQNRVFEHLPLIELRDARVELGLIDGTIDRHARNTARLVVGLDLVAAE